MTLTESLLQSLSSNTERGRHTLSVRAPGWDVQVLAERGDTLAAAVRELVLERTGDAPADLTLRGWAEGAASRVVGLLEPLKVLEVDDGRGEALLRSTAPAKKGEQVSYYEVKLVGTTRAEVRRFTASRAASGREQIAFALTHEVLAKLAGDIAG